MSLKFKPYYTVRVETTILWGEAWVDFLLCKKALWKEQSFAGLDVSPFYCYVQHTFPQVNRLNFHSFICTCIRLILRHNICCIKRSMHQSATEFCFSNFICSQTGNCTQ
jgi:hypothetical protein